MSRRTVLFAQPLIGMHLPALLLLGSVTAHAHDPGCSAQTDPPARLACYDLQFPPSVSTGQAYHEQASAAFGRRDAGSANPVVIEQLSARLRQVHQQGRQVVVELDNGQRWLVTEGRLPPLPVDSRLIVRKAALSGHQLLTENGLAVRVRRQP